MYDAIIVGSGASGTFAAYALRGKNVLVLDVGKEAPAASQLLTGNLNTLRKTQECLESELLGNRFESLHNISRDYLSPKLKAPFIRYTIDDESLSPVEGKEFYSVVSHAKGGLANAWGAGAYAFTDRDLKGFPLKAADLRPYYATVGNHVGICGADDDLQSYFPADHALLPPLELNRVGHDLLNEYTRRRDGFQRRGIFVGRSRLAVLTRDDGDRTACDYNNLEFFKPRISAVYNPAYTLEQLVRDGAVTYRPGMLVRRYQESDGRVTVMARELSSGQEQSFEGRKCILAAGTLNTTRIVLSSANDTRVKLPLLDNAISYVPLVKPRFIGGALEERTFATAQLNIVYDQGASSDPVQATFYGLSGPLRSDYLLNFPLTMRGNLAAARLLTPAMAIIQVFYPDVPRVENHIRLKEDGTLAIRYQPKNRGEVESRLISAFRRAGYVGHSSLCQYPTAGNSFHYAGTLPMRETPGPYETDRMGRLGSSRNVFIADGANFSMLPSKNLTFTLMANAMRIASQIRFDLN